MVLLHPPKLLPDHHHCMFDGSPTRIVVSPYSGWGVAANVGNFSLHRVPGRVQSLVYPAAKKQGDFIRSSYF